MSKETDYGRRKAIKNALVHSPSEIGIYSRKRHLRAEREAAAVAEENRVAIEHSTQAAIYASYSTTAAGFIFLTEGRFLPAMVLGTVALVQALTAKRIDALKEKA